MGKLILSGGAYKEQDAGASVVSVVNGAYKMQAPGADAVSIQADGTFRAVDVETTVSGRYLALYAEGPTSASGYNYMAFVLREIQIFSTADNSGTNHALNRDCFASREYSSAENAVDGSVSTTWISHHDSTAPYQWWAVDLGSSIDIRSLYMYPHPDWTPSTIGVWVSNTNTTPPSEANGWTKIRTIEPVWSPTWQGFVLL